MLCLKENENYEKKKNFVIEKGIEKKE